MGGGAPVCARLPPPPSLRKPHVSGTAPNRTFLRGFPTTHFPDFCLCDRSPILVAIFGGLSPHPKIPFPAAEFGAQAEVGREWDRRVSAESRRSRSRWDRH